MNLYIYRIYKEDANTQHLDEPGFTELIPRPEGRALKEKGETNSITSYRVIHDQGDFTLPDDLKNVLKKNRPRLHIHSREPQGEHAKNEVIKYMHAYNSRNKESSNCFQKTLNMIESSEKECTVLFAEKRWFKHTKYSLTIFTTPS